MSLCKSCVFLISKVLITRPEITIGRIKNTLLKTTLLNITKCVLIFLCNFGLKHFSLNEM